MPYSDCHPWLCLPSGFFIMKYRLRHKEKSYKISLSAIHYLLSAISVAVVQCSLTAITRMNRQLLNNSETNVIFPLFLACILLCGGCSPRLNYYYSD
ncbi:hypothetical protein V1517DRAFT_333215 [Lipomyces orientalis]|uniref:Uncharacterized protein n=1 Tax=Lipomyces orientalis TaxID=1233043 RepID=A0ACC3TDK3_9ASCO